MDVKEMEGLNLENLQKIIPKQDEFFYRELHICLQSMTNVVLQLNTRQKQSVKMLPKFLSGIVRSLRMYCENPNWFFIDGKDEKEKAE